jgi:hypothetical protein
VPHSIAVSIPLLEIASIIRPIYPDIFPEAFRKAIYKLPAIFITVRVVFDSLSVLESILEISQVEIALVDIHLPLAFSYCP